MGQIAKDNIQLFKSYDRPLQGLMQEFKEMRRVVGGNPYTEEQKERIEKLKLNPGMFINFYVPTVATIVGMMYSNNNRVTAVPMGKDPSKAFVVQPIMASLFEESDWNIIYPDFLQDYAILGIAWAGVDVDTDFNPRPLGVRLERIDPLKMRWPLTYTYPMMDDADSLVRYEILTVKQAIIKTGKSFSKEMLETFKDSVDEFDEYKGLTHLGDMSIDSEKIENSRVLYLESQTKETRKYQRLLFQDETGEHSEDIPVDKKYINAEGEEVYENVYSYWWKLAKNKDGETSEILKRKVEKLKHSNGLTEKDKSVVIKKCSIGGHDIGEYELPTHRYTWTPLSFDMFETGVPVGVVKNIRPLVHGMNENIHLLLLNGRIANQVRILAPSDSINNKETLAIQLQETGGVIDYALKSYPDGSPAKPEIIPPFNISSDFYQMQNMFAELVNVIASINEAMIGEFKGEQPSNITMQNMKESGTAKFKPKAMRAQATICRIAAVAFDFIKVYSLKDKVLRIIDNDDENEDMYLNQQAGPEEDYVAAIVKSGGKKVGRRVNRSAYNAEIPINYRYQSGDQEILINNLQDAEIDVDFRMVGAPSTETARRIWQQGIAIVMNQFPQSSQVLLKEFLKLSEYPQAFKVAKNIDELTNLQGRLSAMEEATKNMKRRMLNLIDQNVRAKQEAAVSVTNAQYKSKLDKVLNDYQLKMEMMEAGAETDYESDIADLEKLMDQMDDLLEQSKDQADAVVKNVPENTENELTQQEGV